MHETAKVMGRKPLVSVGMPVYNGGRYLAGALDSLLAQTFDDFELIICDNASTDDTDAICAEYAARDPRIRYFPSSVNIGAAANFRRVFELSSGIYFRWATYDDLNAPTYIAQCVEILDRDPSVVLAYGKTRFIDEAGEIESEYNDRLHLPFDQVSARFIGLCNNLVRCNVQYGLIRTEALRQTLLLGNYHGGDNRLIAELILYGKFWEIPEFLFFRRFHPDCSSENLDLDFQQEFYDPSTVGGIDFPYWKRCSDYCRVIWRSPIKFSTKLYLECYVVYYALRRWRLLGLDLIGAWNTWKKRLRLRKSRQAVATNDSARLLNSTTTKARTKE
jgi:glycosyltransferase involved in cell wall biosynthesis